MNRILRTSFALGTLAAVAMGVTACAPGASDDEAAGGVQKVLVATGASPKPYTYLDENDELTGYDIEILKLIDDKLEDIDFEFQVAEFPALFAGLDSGRFNIVANNLSATDERREKYDFSDPYTEAQFGIIQVTDASDVQSLEDLAGKSTYGEPGLNFTRVLENYNEQNPGKEVKIEYTELDLQSQYNNLAAGTVDFLFNERVVFQGYGGSSGLDLGFSPLDGEYLSESFGTNLFSAYALSKQTPNVADVVSKINGALDELKADGTLKQLSEKFFDGIDVTPKSEPAKN